MTFAHVRDLARTRSVVVGVHPLLAHPAPEVVHEVGRDSAHDRQRLARTDASHFCSASARRAITLGFLEGRLRGEQLVPGSRLRRGLRSRDGCLLLRPHDLHPNHTLRTLEGIG